MSLEYLVVKWEIEDTTESLEAYKYLIYRCTGADNEDEYELVKSVEGNRFEYMDITATQHKRGINYYYKIVPQNIETQAIGKVCKCISMYDKKNDIYANYIRHVNKVYLNVINNDNGYILIKRRFGQKCSRCWDDIRRQHKQSKCPNCFGTGYEGGYHPPSKISFNYLSTTYGKSENVGVDGRGDNSQDIMLWTGSYPLISIGDIFIDENNDRFKVVQVQKTTKNNEFILRQILNLQLLSTSDPAYDIIIDTGGDLSD